MRIYLAGAIDQASEEDVSTWRDYSIKELRLYGAEGVSPLVPEPQGRDLTPAEIYERDLALLKSCDAVVAEMWLPCPHYGTAVEVECAVAAGMPVVVWTGGKLPSVFLRRHSEVLFRFDLDDALHEATFQAALRHGRVLVSRPLY